MIELAVAKFSVTKGLGFIIAFAICTFWQTRSPHHPNLKADYNNSLINLPLAFINSVILSLFGAKTVIKLADWVTVNHFGLIQKLNLPTFLQIIMTILILDLVAYGWHMANHFVPFLWRFHSVHHSDTNFDTSTSVRFHIGELLISMGVRALVVYLLGLPRVGLLAFELIYQFFNTFEHGNICLPARFESILEKVFVTPALHRKHHSKRPAELNSNFSTIFSFWDRLGQTYYDSHSSEKFEVGLADQSRPLDFMQILMKPFAQKPKEEAVEMNID